MKSVTHHDQYLTSIILPGPRKKPITHNKLQTKKKRNVTNYLDAKIPSICTVETYR